MGINDWELVMRKGNSVEGKGGRRGRRKVSYLKYVIAVIVIRFPLR